MDSKTLDKLTKLNALVALDEEYQKMELDWRQFEKEFESYVDPLPKEIRNFLWGYAHMGVLMGNRKIVLARENMEFIE